MEFIGLNLNLSFNTDITPPIVEGTNENEKDANSNPTILWSTSTGKETPKIGINKINWNWLKIIQIPLGELNDNRDANDDKNIAHVRTICDTVCIVWASSEILLVLSLFVLVFAFVLLCLIIFHMALFELSWNPELQITQE